MIERLRTFLDRPLDPSAARATLAFSSAVLVGLAVLFVLAAGEPDQKPSTKEWPSSNASPAAPIAPAEAGEGERSEPRSSTPMQDPQDAEGSAAGRRVARVLRSHRALQHVPYRDGQLAVVLIGARGRQAVLRVTAPTVGKARRGWRRFLRRYHDAGRAYRAVFARRGGSNG